MTHQLLIADDDSDIVNLLSCRCEGMGLKVDTAGNAMLALEKAEKSMPDVIVLDINMPYGNGLSVCEMMAGHEDLSKIPVIILTGKTDDETIMRCQQLSAHYVPKGPGVWSRLEPLLNELLGDSEASGTLALESDNVDQEEFSSPAPLELLDTVFALLSVETGDSLIEDESNSVEPRSDRPWVLSIEDDADVALALKLRLEQHGVQVVRATAGKEGYRRAFMDKPRAILLDYELPQGNGDYVLRRLKESAATADIPVIVLTGRRESEIERQMLSLGASDFLTKPFDWERLRTALDRHLDLENSELLPA